MAKWNAEANVQFANLQSWSGLSNAQLDSIRSTISVWADSDPNEDTHIFTFGRFRKGGLRVRLNDGWITEVVFIE